MTIDSGGRHRIDLVLTPLPGILELSSAPPGATIIVDGSTLEQTTTPATIELEPGDHMIELRLEGYESLAREVSISADGRHELVLGLVPEPRSPGRAPVEAEEHVDQHEASPAEAPPSDTPRRWRPWAWVVIGSGVALAVAGGVLDIVAFTQSRRTEPTENLGDYRHWQDVVRGTALAGDVLLPLGVATAVGGLIWLLISRRREQRTGQGTGITGVGGTFSPQDMTLHSGLHHEQ